MIHSDPLSQGGGSPQNLNGTSMNHEQHRHEQHEQERKEKRAHERQTEAEFSKPGKPAMRPVWVLVVGIVLSLLALFIWMRV
jgi:hypothetical protein